MGKVLSNSISLLPPLFSRLHPRDQALLKEAGTLEHYKKDEVLFKEGAFSTRMVVLHSGYFKFCSNNRAFDIGVPGTVFGGTFTKPSPNSCSVSALGPLELYSFPSDVVKQAWLANPQMLLEILDYAIVRVQQYQRFLYELGTPKLETRLGFFLWSIGRQNPDGTRTVPRELSQAVLAEIMKASREEISRKKKLLHEIGVISSNTGTQTILSKNAPLLLELDHS